MAKIPLSLNHVREKAEKVGLHWSFNRDLNKGQWTVKCSACNASETHSFHNLEVSEMQERMRRLGWRMGYKHGNQCPSCVAKKPEEKIVNEQPIHTLHQQSIKLGPAEPAFTPPNAAPLPSIAPSAKIMKEVYRALDDLFDEHTKLYKSGATDENIAKKIGCSPALVEKTRREGYGELAQDPAITKLVTDFEALKKATDDAITVALERFDAGCRRFEAQLANITKSHKAAG